MLTDEYIKRVYDQVVARDGDQPEFLQAVREVFESLQPVVEKHPEYEKAGVLERIVEPERIIKFRVAWVDDEGKVQVNRGYRIQFNSAIGPYKGGLRFHPTVNRVRRQVPWLRADSQELPDHACRWAAARAAPTSTRRASPTLRSCASARPS